MTGPVLTAAVLTAFVISALAVRTIGAVASRRGMFDVPGARSAHAAPVPRLGGLGIWSGLLAGCAVLTLAGSAPAGLWRLLACGLLVGIVGLVDDLRPQPILVRLTVHAVAAGLVVLGTPAKELVELWSAPYALATAATLIWILWFTNLYNFMDGIDGLAGGQAVSAALALAAASLSSGDARTAGALAVLAAAAGGFLPFNFPQARIFMGDAGSTALGFLFACSPLLPGDGAPELGAVAIALAVFVADATSTLVARVFRGERWWEPHRSHWYQRPLAAGICHREITTRLYGAMAVCGLGAYLWPTSGHAERTAILLGAVTMCAVGAAVVLRVEKRRGEAHKEDLG